MKARSLFVRHASLPLLLLAVAVTAAADDAMAVPTNNEPQYSWDCSFAIMSTDLSNCPVDLGDKGSFYEDYMNGCRNEYGEICDTNEQERIEMNIRQPSSLKNFTSTGFMKIRAPDNVVELITDFWNKNHHQRYKEDWPKASIYTNHWACPTDFLNIFDENLEGGGEQLADAIWEAARNTIEEWTGMKQRPSSIYGVRVYTDGAVLSPHCDRMPLISSAIVNVAQDVEEDWPIEVYGHDGVAVNVTMKPGDMVLYESGTIIHGRPFPLRGNFYANVFIHFEPVGFTDGTPFINIEDPDLPPYIIAGSKEAHYQHEYFLDNRQRSHRIDISVHNAAGDGDLEALHAYAGEDSTQLYLEDENGWQPIHEAARMGQMEAVQFLLEHDANMNSRTDFGEGMSPLSLALKHNGPEHVLVKYLESLGAEAHHYTPSNSHFGGDYDHDYDYGYDEEVDEEDEDDEDEDEDEEDEDDEDEEDEDEDEDDEDEPDL